MKRTNEEVLKAARVLLTHNAPELQGRRAISAIAVGRRCLEDTVGEWLADQGHSLERSNMKERLLCVQSLHPDEGLAREVGLVWEQLSKASHATSYEQSPSDADIRSWLEVIDRFQTFAG